MQSPLSRLSQQRKNELNQKFKMHQSKNPIIAENNSRVTMLFCLFKEYLKDLKSTTDSTTEELMTKLELAVNQFQNANPRFLSTDHYTGILLELKNLCNHAPALSVRDRVQMSFLNHAPVTAFGVLADTVEKDVKDNGVKDDSSTNSWSQMSFSDDTIMLVSGYFDDIAQRAFNSCSDPWFKLLA